MVYYFVTLCCRILYLYNMTGHWAYPFMKHFTPFMFGLFIVGSVMTCGVFYCIGLLVARACGNISESVNFSTAFLLCCPFCRVCEIEVVLSWPRPL